MSVADVVDQGSLEKVRSYKKAAKAAAKAKLWDRDAMAKTHLSCPCGEAIAGTDEDDLVEKAQSHLSEAHPGREYDREMILFMAY